MIKFLNRLFRQRERDDPVVRCHQMVMAQARRPEFYLHLDVPDTLDGRFELLALHAFMVMRRLKLSDRAAQRFSRLLFEHMVTDFDRSLREMGVGDMGVPARVKRMVQGINGRLRAYDCGVNADDGEALLIALDNNLYGTVMDPDPRVLTLMADYTRKSVTNLDAQPLRQVLEGFVYFIEPLY